MKQGLQMITPPQDYPRFNPGDNGDFNPHVIVTPDEDEAPKVSPYGVRAVFTSNGTCLFHCACGPRLDVIWRRPAVDPTHDHGQTDGCSIYLELLCLTCGFSDVVKI